MLNVIIAEDDPEVRNILKYIITRVPDVNVMTEVETGQQAVEAVEELKPDVVFLDVNMPEMSGAEAAKKIFNIDSNIMIVFATGYGDYALNAFEVYAFDYIMKPFEPERIFQTIGRVKEKKAKNQQLQLMEKVAGQITKKNSKIKIQSCDHFNIINIKDIIFITRSGRQTVLHTISGTIKTYEALEKLHLRLKGWNFFRSHKGFIINVDMVTELSPWGHKTYLVKLANTKETALMTLGKVKEFQKMYFAE